MSKIISDQDIMAIMADRLTILRNNEKISQAEMAQLIHSFQSGYARSEQGIRQMNIENLYYIATEFGINLNWLFGLSDNKSDPGTRVHHQNNLALKMKHIKRQSEKFDGRRK